MYQLAISLVQPWDNIQSKIHGMTATIAATIRRNAQLFAQNTKKTNFLKNVFYQYVTVDDIDFIAQKRYSNRICAVVGFWILVFCVIAQLDCLTVLIEPEIALRATPCAQQTRLRN